MTVPFSIDPAWVVEELTGAVLTRLARGSCCSSSSTRCSRRRPTRCAAPSTAPGARSGSTSSGGYRHRDFDTRTGTLDVAVPKLRQGSFFPDWLLECRKRAETALTSVVATCHLLGVSTRRMDKLVQSSGITGLSKSQVSDMAKHLDEQVWAGTFRGFTPTTPPTFIAALICGDGLRIRC